MYTAVSIHIQYEDKTNSQWTSCRSQRRHVGVAVLHWKPLRYFFQLLLRGSRRTKVETKQINIYMTYTCTFVYPKNSRKSTEPKSFLHRCVNNQKPEGEEELYMRVITYIAGILGWRYFLFSQVVERKIHKTNIYSRKRGPVTQGLPAITWYPPSDEQSPTNKVQKWLNKHSENSMWNKWTVLDSLYVLLLCVYVGKFRRESFRWK